MKILWIAPSLKIEDDYVFGNCARVKDEVAKYAEIIPIDLSDFSKNQIVKFFQFQIALFNAMRRKPDLIFTHMSQIGSLMALPLNLFYRLPHFCWYARESTGWECSILKHFVVFVTSSEEGCRTEPRIILQQMIDTEKFKPIKTKKEFIVYTGRISPVKKIEDLIEAYREVDTKLPLLIIGQPTNDKYYHQLLTLAEQVRSPKSIKFIPEGVPFSKIESYYQKAVLFVSPSLTNSFDKTTLEAASCGTPVLACGAAFINDPRIPRDCVWDPKNSGELVEKVQNLLDSAALQKKTGYKLREYIAKNHSLESFAKRFVKVLKERVHKS